jgi:hypothetical protein
MTKIVLNNAKDIGDGWYEAKCMTCGEEFLFQVKEVAHIHIDENGQGWPLCAKCYGETQLSERKSLPPSG